MVSASVPAHSDSGSALPGDAGSQQRACIPDPGACLEGGAKAEDQRTGRLCHFLFNRAVSAYPSVQQIHLGGNESDGASVGSSAFASAALRRRGRASDAGQCPACGYCSLCLYVPPAWDGADPGSGSDAYLPGGCVAPCDAARAVRWEKERSLLDGLSSDAGGGPSFGFCPQRMGEGRRV